MEKEQKFHYKQFSLNDLQKKIFFFKDKKKLDIRKNLMKELLILKPDKGNV